MLLDMWRKRWAKALAEGHAHGRAKNVDRVAPWILQMPTPRRIDTPSLLTTPFVIKTTSLQPVLEEARRMLMLLSTQNRLPRKGYFCRGGVSSSSEPDTRYTEYPSHLALHRHPDSNSAVIQRSVSDAPVQAAGDGAGKRQDQTALNLC